MLDGYVGKEYLRKLSQENRPVGEVVFDFMKLGREIIGQLELKDYSSVEEFFDHVEAGNSPLHDVDPNFKTIARFPTMIWMGVYKCPMKETLKELVQDPSSENLAVLDVIGAVSVGESSTLPYGSYLLLQIRQMVVSAISVKGHYLFNLLNLTHQNIMRDGTALRTDIVINQDSVQKIAKETELSVGEIEERIKQLESENDNDLCIYAIYTTE